MASIAVITVIQLCIHCILVAGLFLDSNYVSISTKTFKHSTLCSLSPQSWLLKSISSTSRSRSKACIKEILYIPSFLSLAGDNELKICCSDEHFCSLLCDQGYIVHILHHNLQFSTQTALQEVLSTRFQSKSLHSLAIISHELSIPKFLNALSQSLLPPNNGFSSSNSNPFQLSGMLGAIILIDPPPIHSVLSAKGREQSLERYTRAFNSFESFR